MLVTQIFLQVFAQNILQIALLVEFPLIIVQISQNLVKFILKSLFLSHSIIMLYKHHVESLYKSNLVIF